MKKIKLFGLFCVIVLLAIVLVYCFVFNLFGSEKTEKFVICFFTSWAQYRAGKGRFFAADVDASLCTHITYAHLMVDLETHRLVNRQKNDDQQLKQLVALKKENPSLKIIVSVGGWNHEKEPRFSRMVQNETTRGIFIESAIAYMQSHNLDGISIDWEYPTHRGTSVPEDKHRYTLLLKEFRESFKQQENKMLTLSASVSAGRKIISTAYEASEITKYVDWVNVMAYALHGAWKSETGHHTAMAGSIPNILDSLKAWQEIGMPNNKISLGLATYGRTFTLENADKNDLGDPVLGAGYAGPFTGADGVLSFYEFCNLTWSRFTPFQQSKAKKPYASKGDQWVGYESPESIAYEVRTVFTENCCLRGISIWTIGYDDFSGQFCKKGVYPLINSAVKALNDAPF